MILDGKGLGSELESDLAGNLSPLKGQPGVIFP